MKLDATKDNLAHCPWPNRTPGMMGSPTYLNVRFKIVRAGKYTLQFALGDAKPTPKNFLLWLDGRNIFTEPGRIGRPSPTAIRSSRDGRPGTSASG
jgi:hypothetical protein